MYVLGTLGSPDVGLISLLRNRSMNGKCFKRGGGKSERSKAKVSGSNNSIFSVATNKREKAAPHSDGVGPTTRL